MTGTTGTTVILNNYNNGQLTTNAVEAAIDEFLADTPSRLIPLTDEVESFLAGIRQRQKATLGPKGRPRNWFRVENAAETDTADVYIFDEIVDPIFSEFFGLGVSALGFIRELQGLKGKTINLHIDSPGGDIFQGLGIYNALRQHDGAVHVIVDGIAASIASVIAMGGDTVTMNPHTRMMIHLPWAGVVGDEFDMAKQSDILHKLGEDIAGIYRDRGDKRINWFQRMKDESWFSDTEAVAVGLADAVNTQANPARNRFDLSRYRNVPDDLATASDSDADTTPTKREIEDALRDAGLSSGKAKAFVSEGWKVFEARDESETLELLEETEPTGEETAVESTGTVEDAEQIVRRANARRRELELMELQLA